MRFLLVALLFAFIGAAFATYGVDVSQRTYSSHFECMVDYGYSFTVVRAYRSSGKVDSNAPYTINDAWAGGMSYVDAYIFPDYFKGDGGAQQVKDTINYLRANGVKHVPRLHNGTSPTLQEGTLAKEEVENYKATFGMLWLDIEGSQYWSSNSQNNVDFIQDMADECDRQGVYCGIYSSAYTWNPITGYSTQFKDMPLWYAHYDNDPSFSDFKSFGGWTRPAIKQYAGDVTLCYAGVDKNYY